MTFAEPYPALLRFKKKIDGIRERRDRNREKNERASKKKSNNDQCNHEYKFQICVACGKHLLAQGGPEAW
jgi:hypothetical protein